MRSRDDKIEAQAKRIEELGRSLAEQRTTNAANTIELNRLRAENQELRDGTADSISAQYQTDKRKLEVLARALDRERDNAQHEHAEYVKVVKELERVQAELNATHSANLEQEKQSTKRGAGSTPTATGSSRHHGRPRARRAAEAAASAAAETASTHIKASPSKA